jgi:hypothetical protein
MRRHIASARRTIEAARLRALDPDDDAPGSEPDPDPRTSAEGGGNDLERGAVEDTTRPSTRLVSAGPGALRNPGPDPVPGIAKAPHRTRTREENERDE